MFTQNTQKYLKQKQAGYSNLTRTANKDGMKVKHRVFYTLNTPPGATRLNAKSNGELLQNISRSR